MLWSKVVETLIASYTVAPEPTVNPLVELEVELGEAVVLDLEANLPQ
jgi:hypothetical protein